jgi:hypothetical protein
MGAYPGGAMGAGVVEASEVGEAKGSGVSGGVVMATTLAKSGHNRILLAHDGDSFRGPIRCLPQRKVEFISAHDAHPTRGGAAR